MALLDRLRELLAGPRAAPPPEPRHVRRERARERARETGGDPWPDEEHLDEQAPHTMPTITPGTPGNTTVR